LALAGAALFAVYTYYGNGAPPAEIAGNIISGFTDASPTEIAENIISRFTRKEETAAVKKPDNPDGGGVGRESGGGGKSVADILGGPAFQNAKQSIHTVALRGGEPEPPVKTSLPSRSPRPDAEAAPPQAQSLPAPPPRPLPSFPKTNMPTLNFTVEQPPAPQPVAVAAPPPQPQPPPPPPPPPLPPPPKPRATLTMPNVSGCLADRADVNVNMSIDLEYEPGNAMREELEFKRDMLVTLAGAVIHKHEYGTINIDAIKTDVLAALNEQLQAGKLVNVEIRDFQVGGPAVAGK
jgi:hypothetical protein